MDVNLVNFGPNSAEIDYASQTAVGTDSLQHNSVAVSKSDNPIDNTKDISAEADSLIEQQVSEDHAVTLDDALSNINEFVQSKSRQLNFSVDDDSGRQVIKVTDAGSGDVIRQIPTEDVLKLSARIQELQTDVSSAVGLIFDNQA